LHRRVILTNLVVDIHNEMDLLTTSLLDVQQQKDCAEINWQVLVKISELLTGRDFRHTTLVTSQLVPVQKSNSVL